jgi:hypothetical protein
MFGCICHRRRDCRIDRRAVMTEPEIVAQYAGIVGHLQHIWDPVAKVGLSCFSDVYDGPTGHSIRSRMRGIEGSGRRPRRCTRLGLPRHAQRLPSPPGLVVRRRSESRRRRNLDRWSLPWFGPYTRPSAVLVASLSQSPKRSSCAAGDFGPMGFENSARASDVGL